MSTDIGVKPPTTLETARALLARLYPQLTVVKLTELNGYDDRNYRVTTSDGQQYVLKVTNSADSADKGMLEGQNQMMLHLAQHHPAISAPVPIQNSLSDYITRESFTTNGPQFAIRLLRFLPGTRLLDNQPINSSLLLQSGEFLGRLQTAINDGGYSNEVIKTRISVWSMESIPELRKYVHVLTSERRAWVERAIGDFESQVLAKKNQFPHAYIHGDFNEQNILVENGSVSAVIDFGDICYVPRVFDIAIAIIYLMLLETANLDPVLEGPKFVLEGFLKHVKLTEKELEVLLICATARLAQSLTLGAYTYSQQPGNEYLLSTQAKGWGVMKRLMEVNQSALVKQWLEQIGSL